MFVKFCSNDWNSIVLDMLIPRFLMLSQIDIAKDTIGNLTENSSIFKLTKESNDQTRNLIGYRLNSMNIDWHRLYRFYPRSDFRSCKYSVG